MSRDPLARMDVDTHWAYHRKMRRLQRLYPEQWPTYWCAYLALLGEAWATGRRSLTLDQTWVPAMPCTLEEALAALVAAEIVDSKGRVPQDSWKEWYEPVAKRLKGRSDAGQIAAHKRWHTGEFDACAECAVAMRSHSPRNANGYDRNAPRPPRPPTTPPRASRARGARSNDRDGEEREAAIARAKATLSDPQASDDRQEVARFQLRQLGVPA